MSAFTQRIIQRAIKASQLRMRPAEMSGTVLFITPGIQTVRTDSRIHPIIKCVAGKNWIDGAKPGDKVRLWYRVDPRMMFGMWYGRVV